MAVVSNNRNLESEDIQNFSDTYDDLVIQENGNTAKAALNYNLADKLLNRNQQRDYLVGLVGSGEEEKSFAQVSLNDYLTVAKIDEGTNRSRNKIVFRWQDIVNYASGFYHTKVIGRLHQK